MNNAPKPPKAALYARVSTDMQAAKDTSIPVQKELLVNYTQNILHVPYVFFSDAGFTGTNTSRPSFQDMMNRIRKNEFTYVIVFKIDRISRSLTDFLSMHEEFTKHGASFISLQENFNTSTPIGEAMQKILLIFAEMEVHMTKQRVTAVMLNRAKHGKWNGGSVPFGYTRKNDQFSIYKEQADLVRTIFRLYTTGTSASEIAKNFNFKGIPAVRGGLWNGNTINCILDNTFYIGTYTYNRRLPGSKRSSFRDEKDWVKIPNFAPPIIDAVTFQNAQKKRQEVRQYMALSRRQTIPGKSLFYHLIYCGDCGFPFSGRFHGKSTFLISDYSCSKAVRYRGCHNRVYWNDTKVGSFVLTYIRNLFSIIESKDKKYTRLSFEQALCRGLLTAAYMKDKSVTSVSVKDSGVLFDLLSQNFKSHPYSPSENTKQPEVPDHNKAEIQKYTRALKRLQTLYLYDDSALTPAEYTEEKKKLESKIEALTPKTESHPQKLTSIDSLFEKKSDFLDFFILRQHLVSDETINFRGLASEVDRTILYDFLHKTIKKITILGLHIISIEFVSGAVHEFSYGDENGKQS